MAEEIRECTLTLLIDFYGVHLNPSTNPRQTVGVKFRPTAYGRRRTHRGRACSI